MIPWGQWIEDLDKRESEYVDHPPLNTIKDKNIHALQSLADGLFRHCANPFCGWPIKSNRDQNFQAPFVGEICATCHDIYVAISFMNPFLRVPKFFHNAHDEWVKETEKDKQHRKNMGLNEDGVA